jgi:hypothetical protein
MQQQIFAWIQSTWLSQLMHHSEWLFTSMEVIHFMGLSVLLASVAILDLRVLGVVKRIPMSKLDDLVPLALIGFAIQLTSGVAMFSAQPAKYWGNIGFRIKMVVLLCAGLNALWYWLLEAGDVRTASRGAIKLSAKVTAVLSLLLWLTVLTFGRIITYLDGVELP